MALRDCLERVGAFDAAERDEIEAALAERVARGADARQAADALILERLQAAIAERNAVRADVERQLAERGAAPAAADRPAPPSLADSPLPDLLRQAPDDAAAQVSDQAEAGLQRWIDAGLLRGDEPELLELRQISAAADRDMRVAEAAGFCLGRS